MVQKKVMTADKKLIADFSKKFHLPKMEYQYLTTGTDSKVILLNNKYVIKQNGPQAIQAEVTFLSQNVAEYMQKIVYVDPEYTYAVYEFIQGEIGRNLTNFLGELAHITKNYQSYSKEGYGYLFAEVPTWAAFLTSEVSSPHEKLGEFIPGNSVVFQAISYLEKFPFEKKLLHGDFGVHNFIQKNHQLVGVIDPQTVIGDYLYDFLFAVVSSGEMMKKVNLDLLYKIVDEPKDKVFHLLLVVLYGRISRCLYHHPEDLEIYLEIWHKLTKGVKKMKYPWLDDYCTAKKGAIMDYKEEWEAYRYLIGGKMFGMKCHNKEGKPIVTLKLDIPFGEFLRQEYEDITPGYYMNKQHWNSLNLEGDVPEEVLKDMIDQSYKLIFQSLTKKHRKRF